jgi:hypothetical protein
MNRKTNIIISSIASFLIALLLGYTIYNIINYGIVHQLVHVIILVFIIPTNILEWVFLLKEKQ